MTRQLVIFTDLDGCLLNKHDYSWEDAATCLRRLHELKVPVVLSSSKTVAEMAVLADELPIDSFPFVAENGGVVCWRSAGQGGSEDNTINGARREDILKLLQTLKSRFQFRSFDDLGLSGVMTHTDLSEAAARRACDRHTTEPLLWDDSENQRLEFQEILHQSDFTFTKGGRFWHIAGHTTKGRGMQQVLDRLQSQSPQQEFVTAAVGDSPIDQSMLDLADAPIGIRVGGELSVKIDSQRGVVPKNEGAAGWAEGICEVLRRFGYDEGPSGE